MRSVIAVIALFGAACGPSPEPDVVHVAGPGQGYVEYAVLLDATPEAVLDWAANAPVDRRLAAGVTQRNATRQDSGVRAELMQADGSQIGVVAYAASVVDGHTRATVIVTETTGLYEDVQRWGNLTRDIAQKMRRDLGARY